MLSRMRFHLPIASACVLIVMGAGCSKNPDYLPVMGSVSLDGKPVAKASVMFHPENGGRPAWAITDDDGSFALTTFKSGDGTLLGNHVVTVTLAQEGPPKKQSHNPDLTNENASVMEMFTVQQPNRKKWIVPEKYSDTDTSGLTFTVADGADNNATFELESK
jgi:hypothetical protein